MAKRPSRNALRHGLLSRELLLPEEDAREFQALMDDLCADFQPAGTLERSLVERIAIGLWRQRRLVRAESAQINLAQSKRTPGSGALPAKFMSQETLIAASIAQHAASHTLAALRSEITRIRTTPALRQMTLAAFRAACPLTGNYLIEQSYADSHPDTTVAAFLGNDLDRLIGQFDTAAADFDHRRGVDVLERDSQLIPPRPELLARYQTALDNDLYKALRALREAQHYRRERAVFEAKSVDAADAD